MPSPNPLPANHQLPEGEPFVLGLAHELVDFRMVRTHWTKNFLRKFAADDLVHQLMERILAQIRADGYVVREYYELPYSPDPSPADGVTKQEIYDALRRLDRIIFGFEMPLRQEYTPRALLDGTHKRHFGNDSNCWTIRFNPVLNNYLLNVAQLRYVLPLPSPPRVGPKSASRPCINSTLEELLAPAGRRRKA